MNVIINYVSTVKLDYKEISQTNWRRELMVDTEINEKPID